LKTRAGAALAGCADVGCLKGMPGGTYRETRWRLRSRDDEEAKRAADPDLSC